MFADERAHREVTTGPCKHGQAIHERRRMFAQAAKIPAVERTDPRLPINMTQCSLKTCLHH